MRPLLFYKKIQTKVCYIETKTIFVVSIKRNRTAPIRRTKKNKVMKAETLRKRIEEKLTRKDGEIKNAYSMIFFFIREGFYYGKEYQGRGKYIRLSTTKHDNLRKALDLLGIDYCVKNSAPRGGEIGDYIALTEKGKRQTSQLREFLNSYYMIHGKHYVLNNYE